MDKAGLKATYPTPLYVLLALAICLCAFFFWVGTVCVRLWFYQGALGPAPQKFLIIPHHRKQKPSQRPAPQSNNRMTVFPEVAYLDGAHSNPFSDEYEIPESNPYFTTIPAITVEDTDNNFDASFSNDFEDPARARAYVAEQLRISRLPALTQDDCGDGSEFDYIPYATNPVEVQPSRVLGGTMTYLQLGLRKLNSMGQWLTVDNSYIEHHEARTALLDRKQNECIKVRLDGEDACEELMDQVVQHLCVKYSDHFNTNMKNGRRTIRNELSSEDMSLARPFPHHPIEICARLAVEDFNIFVRNDFTRQWYLQASATLFPAGWNMRSYMGKSLSAIINDMNNPMPLWEDLPDIFPLLTSPTTLFTRTSTYIQTRSPSSTPSSSLHIPRPADFFSGNLSSLLPMNLYVRREHTSFRLLPKCRAVVMTTRTELQKLMDVNDRKSKRELMDEVDGWDEEEAEWKGRSLWIRAVRSWCVGGEVWHDDQTVMDAGALTSVGGE